MSDVRIYIKEASCVVHPSYREGTSRVLLEAASMARSIIGVDVPGCRKVVENGIILFLCKSKDYLDLSDKMQVMISLSFEEREMIGSRGREKIRNEFS